MTVKKMIVTLTAVMAVAAVAIQVTEKSFVEATDADDVFELLSKAATSGVLLEETAAPVTATVTDTVDDDGESGLFDKYSKFMHAYVDDLTSRLVHMNFDLLMGKKDPWITNFDDFLDDVSLRSLLDKSDGEIAPVWILGQKAQLDTWRAVSKEGDDKKPIQEVLLGEFSKPDVMSILTNSDDPVVKAIMKGSQRHGEQVSAWMKMVRKWAEDGGGGDMFKAVLSASDMSRNPWVNGGGGRRQ